MGITNIRTKLTARIPPTSHQLIGVTGVGTGADVLTAAGDGAGAGAGAVVTAGAGVVLAAGAGVALGAGDVTVNLPASPLILTS